MNITPNISHMNMGFPMFFPRFRKENGHRPIEPLHLGVPLSLDEARPWHYSSRRQLAQLWTHESLRVYEDRLGSDAGAFPSFRGFCFWRDGDTYQPTIYVYTHTYYIYIYIHKDIIYIYIYVYVYIQYIYL